LFAYFILQERNLRFAAIVTYVALALALLASPACAGRWVALVIGNGAYVHSSKLANPVNDAGDVAQVLGRIGFEVVEGRDLDKRAMEEKILEFGRKLDGADVALFFYAGHGLQVAGQNYLVPTDAKLERAGDLTFETFDLRQVLAQMETQKRVNLLFLDACRDNPLARSLSGALGASRSGAVGRGLAPVQSAVGTMIAYSTQPDSVAQDGTGHRNSPFATALLKYVGTPGLEISAVMKRVRADVVAATRETQVPWDHSSLLGDVILVPATVPAPQPMGPAADETAWSIIKDTRDPQQLTSFIRQFPASPLRAEAERRLAALEHAAVAPPPVVAPPPGPHPIDTPKIPGGAIAIGIADGGATKGYATGFAVNQPSMNAAENAAVNACRASAITSASAKEHCKVVATFHNKCTASAVDPNSGTPGAGWAVASTQREADSQALDRCRATAGADRSRFCIVTDRFCDGSAR
jgi:hypothetical protein